jgi:DNA polymerase beta
MTDNTIDHTINILSLLDVLRKKEIAAKETFKAKAYSNVIKNIQLLGKPIYKLDDLNGIKGIGEKIHQKLEEYFSTGKMQAVENTMNNVNYEKIQLLMGIHGIGPAKAKQLVEDNNINSIEELQNSQELLNDKQKMGLKYYKHFLNRIPRKEMLVHYDILFKSIHAIDPKFEFEVTGSFRRMASTSGDIDVLITHKDDPPNVDELFKSVVDKLKLEKYICDVFAEGGKKCLAVCRLKRYKTFRRIDLLYTNKKEYPFAVLYFTGDAGFNVSMRQYCLTKGLSLSEHGIKDEQTGKLIDHEFKDEKSIFAYLGLKYVEPKYRTSNAIEPL